MPDLKNQIQIYLAVKNRAERIRSEDTLVVDGFEVSAFNCAADLWNHFREHPVRMVITERRFGATLSGIELIRNVRTHFMLPYTYTVLLSAMNTVREIQEAFAVGADAYLVKPHNPLQLRTQVLGGLRWIAYIDSLTKTGSQAAA